MGVIPKHMASGVLPPYTGDNPARPIAQSPYRSSIAEVIDRFGWSGVRKDILRGLLQYRSELRAQGCVDAVQWLSGSFVDEKAEPGDVDVLILHRPPVEWTQERQMQLIEERPDIFTPDGAKASYGCDAYLFSLQQADAVAQARLLTYFFGLFTHQRRTSAWRGIIQVPLMTPDDDHEAKEILAGRLTYGT